MKCHPKEEAHGYVEFLYFKGYQNKVLTAAEVIDELIKLAKTIQESDKLAEELNLMDNDRCVY